MMKIVRYALYDYWSEVGDPRLHNYPLLSGGPAPLIFLILCYVVLVTWIGPVLMRNYKPFQLKMVILAYNLFNVLTSVYFCMSIIYMSNFGKELFEFEIQPNNDTSNEALGIIRFAWYYFLSKLVDQLETVFFVMRHKQSQVSFLHVYHHASVPLIVWIGVKCAPTSGPAAIFPLLNSAIHAVMYTYYFLSALGPQYRHYLWWKRYITVLQLAQFVIILLYGLAFVYLQRGFPLVFALLPVIQAPLFFALFYNFYRQTYHKKKLS